MCSGSQKEPANSLKEQTTFRPLGSAYLLMIHVNINFLRIILYSIIKTDESTQ